MHVFMSLVSGLIAFFETQTLLIRYTLNTLRITSASSLYYKLRMKELKSRDINHLDAELMAIEAARHHLERCIALIALDHEFIAEAVIRDNKVAETILRDMLNGDDGKMLRKAIKRARKYQIPVEDYLAQYTWGLLYV